MKVLIIGGSGLFGRKTIEKLLPDPEVSSVVSLDIVPPPDWSLKTVSRYLDKFHYVRGDVSHLEDILNAIKLYPVDKLVNWAFIMGDELTANPRKSTLVNALGMCNSFEAARLMGIDRVVYASSETVYGPQTMYGDRAVTEDDQTNPTHSYAVCKLFAEIIAGQYNQQYGINFTGVRATFVTGHGGVARVTRMYSDLISLPAVGKPAFSEVDGVPLFSLVSADDLGEFTRRLLHTPSSPHPVYNLGGPPYSLRDVAEAVKKYIPDAKITFGSQPMLGPGQQSLPAKVNCDRAKKDFGFTFTPLDEFVLTHINDARLEAGLPPLP